MTLNTKIHLARFGDERKAADKENVPLRLSRLGLPFILFVLILGEGDGDTTGYKAASKTKAENCIEKISKKSMILFR